MRIYLTQMGEIPLLSRDEEIRLAKKIEITRKRFRTKLLESDFVLSHCLTILDGVSEGEQPFDRTLHFDSTEEHDREEISKRLIENVKTLNRMLERNKADFRELKRPRVSRAPADERSCGRCARAASAACACSRKSASARARCST